MSFTAPLVVTCNKCAVSCSNVSKLTSARGGEYLWWLSPGRAEAAPGLYHALADVELDLAGFAVTAAGFAALAAEGAGWNG